MIDLNVKSIQTHTIKLIKSYHSHLLDTIKNLEKSPFLCNLSMIKRSKFYPYSIVTLFL
ncbi:hypothetical protein EJK50_1295 [Moraxella catarrhalis]|nr:hypothetical protein EJK50_1295 [Moraxella catarrhalis]